MIVDTDVLIWYLRGNPEAACFIDDCEPVLLSSVTYMELVQGMRNARELQALRKTLQHRKWQVLPVSEIISNRAMTYVEEHFLSGSMQMADALIAATCIEHGHTLATGNLKHYRLIKELVLKPYTP